MEYKINSLIEVPWETHVKGQWIQKALCKINYHDWAFKGSRGSGTQSKAYCRCCGIPHELWARMHLKQPVPTAGTFVVAIDRISGMVSTFHVLEVNLKTGMALIVPWNGTIYTKQRFKQLYNVSVWQDIENDFIDLRRWEVETYIQDLKESLQ